MGFENEPMSADSDVSRPISRRQMLALSSAGLAALAGCGGNDSTETAGSGDETTLAMPGDTDTPSDGTDTETATQTEVEGTPVDEVLDTYQKKLPTDFNWNYYVTNFPSGQARKLFHEIRPQGPYFLENWEYDTDNNVERWTFPQNITWWNGDPVTAEDEYVKTEISRLQAPESSDYESIDLVDDYTLEFTYKEAQNPTIVSRQNALGTPIAVHRDVYREWLEKYQDATTQDERDSITEELQNWTLESSRILDEGLGNHPYELTKVNSQEMLFELREDHPWTKPNQVKKVRIRTLAEAPNIIIKQDKIDLAGGTLPVDFTGPDHLKNIIEYRSLQGSKVMFNNDSKYFSDRKVRRALVHMLDASKIQRFQDPEAFKVTKNCGMGDTWGKEWLGEDFWNSLHEYPYSGDVETGEKLLKEAGYSKQGGSWVDPDGEKVTIDIVNNNWPVFTDGAKALNSQLQGLGFDVNLQVTEYGVWWDNAVVGREYDMMFYYHNNWINHPASYYRPHYPGGLMLAKPDNFRSDIEGWLDEGRERSPLTGVPLTPTVPGEPGALEVSGSGEQINLYETWDGIHKAQSREETVEHLRKLAKFWNYSVPHFHLYQWREGWWGDIKDFDMPVGNEEIALYASDNFALRNGYIKNKYEEE